jgi:hypothetical protein
VHGYHVTAENSRAFYAAGLLMTSSEHLHMQDLQASSLTAYYYAPVLYLSTSTNFTIVESSTQDTTAVKYAGGSLVIRSCSLIHLNQIKIQASQSYGNGGSVSVYNTRNVTLSDMELERSMSEYYSGGAIGMERVFDLKLSNISISHTSAMTNRGGSLDFYRCGSVHIENIRVNNSQARRGGAIALVYCNNVTMYDVLTVNTSAGTGGSLYVTDSAYTTFKELHISHSHATYDNGGAITFYHINNVTLSHIETYETASKYDGGSIEMYQVQALALYGLNCSFSSTGWYGYGGCVNVYYCDQIKFQDLHMTSTYGGYGGGLSLYQMNDIQVSNLTVEGGSGKVGGGVYISGCFNVQVQTVSIANTKTISSTGGGLHLASSLDVLIDGISIAYTSALASVGGGINVQGVQNARLTNMYLHHTVAAQTGGSWMMKESTNITIQNVSMKHGQAKSGGGMYMTSCSYVLLQNVSIQHCEAYTDGGGMMIERDNRYVTLVQTKILANQALEGSGGGVYVSSSNQNLFWLSAKSFQNMQTFESSVYMKTQFTFPNAEAIMIHFDATSTVFATDTHCCAWFNINQGLGTSKRSIYYADSTTTYLPGVDIAPMTFTIPTERVNGSTIAKGNGTDTFTLSFSLYMVYDAISSKENNNVKVYLIPIYPNIMSEADRETETDKESASISTVISDNQANIDGGGMMFKYANSIFILSNAIITSNQAITGNGGGIAFKSIVQFPCHHT